MALLYNRYAFALTGTLIGFALFAVITRNTHIENNTSNNLPSTIQDVIADESSREEPLRFKPLPGPVPVTTECSTDRDSLIPVDQYRHLYDRKYTPGENDEDDEALRRHIRQRWLIGPPNVLDSSRLKPGDVSQQKQSTFVDKLLNKRRNGFFVECGAAGGVLLSNTLFFETMRNWTGLLIEANPESFRGLTGKNRNAYYANVCLSTSKKISQVDFKPAGLVGGIENKMNDQLAGHINKTIKLRALSTVKVTCFPLHTLLHALDVTHVDYFSLDVEGPELEILRTIPFNEITFDAITIEYRITNMHRIFVNETLLKLQELRDFFHDVGGYEEAGILPWDASQNETYNEMKGLDVIFKRSTDF